MMLQESGTGNPLVRAARAGPARALQEVDQNRKEKWKDQQMIMPSQLIAHLMKVARKTWRLMLVRCYLRNLKMMNRFTRYSFMVPVFFVASIACYISFSRLFRNGKVGDLRGQLVN